MRIRGGDRAILDIPNRYVKGRYGDRGLADRSLPDRAYGGVPSVPPPFNPSQIAGLKGWWKADALTLTDGASINNWPDSSVNGINLTAGGTSPVYRSNVVGGNPVARFNANGDVAGSTGAVLPDPNSVFFVGKQTSKATRGMFIAGGNNTWVYVQSNTSGFLEIASNATGTPTADAIDHSGAFHYVSAVFNGASSSAWVDGVQTIGPANVGTRGYGAQIIIGSDGSNVQFLTGDIAEVILYTTAVSPANRQSLESYLKGKYGL